MEKQGRHGRGRRCALGFGLGPRILSYLFFLEQFIIKGRAVQYAGEEWNGDTTSAILSTSPQGMLNVIGVLLRIHYRRRRRLL